MADTAALVYIVTLNWNHCADTLAFLESCAALTYPHLRVLVVDNGSTDGSVAAIAAGFPQAEQLLNRCNLGFAGGMNAGLRHALERGAAYVFVANNDTTLAPDALDVLVAAAQSGGADLVAPAIFYAEPPDRIWSVGGWQRPLLLEVHHADGLAPDGQPFAVDFMTGCGMLLSRHCLTTVGLFDARFFMYYEDADYCVRARRAGLRMLVAPQARMWHKVSVSIGGSDSPAERYHMALSSLQYFRKHVRGWQWLAVAPFRAGSAARTLLRLLRHGRRQAALAYLRGLWHGASA